MWRICSDVIFGAFPACLLWKGQNVTHLLIRQLYQDLAAKSPFLTKIPACHKLSGKVTKQKFRQACHSHLGVTKHSKLYSIRISICITGRRIHWIANSATFPCGILIKGKLVSSDPFQRDRWESGWRSHARNLKIPNQDMYIAYAMKNKILANVSPQCPHNNTASRSHCGIRISSGMSGESVRVKSVIIITKSMYATSKKFPFLLQTVSRWIRRLSWFHRAGLVIQANFPVQ